MYKKIVNNVLLSILVFFGFSFCVNASSIYDYLKSGDIIIGNTTFRNGTWISATRASKAGSLYTMVNNDIDVKTYKYINQNVWYEMDPITDKYKILSKDEINDLNNTLYINFLNNEPITKTYKAKIVEEDEFSGGPNAVHDFFNYLQGDKFIEEGEVTLDYQNQTITCEFNTFFKFSVVRNNQAEIYTGFCDSEFYYSKQGGSGEPYNPMINIISSKLAEGEEFLNQDKVTLTRDNNIEDDGEIYYPANYIEFTINEKLDRYSLEEYDEAKKYLVFDFELSDNKTTNYIRDILSYEENYEYEILDEYNFRLFVEINDMWDNYQQYFLLSYDNQYIPISLNYKGLDLPDTDFEILDIKPANIDIEGNNQSLIIGKEYVEESYIDEEGYTYKDKYYYLNISGNYNYFEKDEKYGNWMVFELGFASDVYLDEIEINASEYIDYFYEIVNDKILLWVDVYTDNEGYYFYLDYGYTYGDTFDNFSIIVNNYVDSINYNNEFLGLYNSIIYEDEEIKVKLEPSESKSADIYYKEDEQKLYFKDGASAIYKDEESYKMFVLNYDALWNSELVGILCHYSYAEGDKNGYNSIGYYYGLADSDYESFEWLPNYVDNEDGSTYVLYYFFNRDKTEAELETISNLEELGVEIVDLSDYYYGEE